MKNSLALLEQWTRTQLARDPRLVARLCNWYEWLATLPRPTRRWLKRKMAVTFAAAALLLALCATPIAHAASITVTPGAAGFADDGKCSLVEAIYNSNTDTQKYTSAGECPAGSGADTITLPNNATLDYTINYGPASALPAVVSTITLEGNNSTIQRDALTSNEFGIVAVYYGDLTLNDTTISGGLLSADDGGGIYNYGGALTLNNSTVSGNKAVNGGGLYLSSNNPGSYVTRLNNSVVSGNTAYNAGGGIASAPFSSIIVYNSTISGNDAAVGGGIATTNTSEIAKSTISGNTAYYGGGILNVEYTGGTLTISKSTISGNKATADPSSGFTNAGGGILNFYGTVDIEQSLIDSNQAQYYGGGIFNGPAFFCARGMENQPQTAACDSKRRNGKKVAAKPNRGVMLQKGVQTLGTHSRKGKKKTAPARPNKPKALPGPLTILSNSTVSGNTAANGAGLMNYYYMGLYNATVTNNTAAHDGGGIVNSGLLGMAGSLITGNVANLYNEIDSCPCGTVTVNGYNLFGNNAETNAQAIYGFTPGPKDFNATSDGDGVSTNIPTARNAILSATAGTNGGSTQTFALISGSPAIDKEPNAECAAPPILGVDQRGFGRNVNGNGVPSSNECDIGAYEFAAATATNVNHLGALVGKSGNVNVKWQSTSEAQLAGFNVWRKTGKGSWKKVNGKLLQAKHSGDAAGAKYRFRDATLRHPELNHYKLEIVYLDGHREWSEVIAVNGKR